MIKKFTILFLFCICTAFWGQAQIRDTVHINILPYTDTSCPGTQLTFWATVTGDSSATYTWYINGVFTGVVQDSFFTTAPTDSSIIYCIIHFTNSFGLPDFDTSNKIMIRRDTLPSRALISLVQGNNPYCSMDSMTFFVYPINGGRVPLYQWFVNGVPVPDADSNYFRGIFADSSVISCLMVADTTCFAIHDSVYSNTITLIRDSITAAITIRSRFDTVCFGRMDTFYASISTYGSATVQYQWFVDSVAVPGAIGPVFYTDSLHNGDSVFCLLISFDSCIRNKMQRSNVIHDSVSPILHTVVATELISGSNPGCVDSLVGLQGLYLNFGANPSTIWYINGIPVKYVSLLDTTFLNGQVVTFTVIGTDRGCRDRDSITSDTIRMIRDVNPVTPLISLIGDLLVSNIAGTYKWYGPGGLIPGATGQTYHPTILGYYWAVLDTGYCASSGSNVLYVSLMGVNDIHIPALKIYPNPTSGKISIEGCTEPLIMHVYNIIGQEIMQESIAGSGKNEKDISGLPDGNYLLVFENKEGCKVNYRISVQKN